MKHRNRLMQLMALNRTAPREYRIEAAANSDEATIYLYDVIGYDWWTGDGVTAKQFAKDLQGIKASTIHLRINSPGGDVFEGRAMVTAIQQHPARVVAHIDGLAASAASFVAMHADEIEITDGAFVMIHNGWTLAMGDRHVMTETSALLAQIDASIIDDYHAKTGKDREELGAMMDAETWINAADAVAMGFADRLAAAQKDSGKKARAGSWNLSAYDHPPQIDAAPNEDDQQAACAERARRLALAVA